MFTAEAQRTQREHKFSLTFLCALCVSAVSYHR